MRKIIINRSNEYNEYIFEITGYIPNELEDDMEEMAELFVKKENLLIEEIQEEINDFKKYHKKRNGIIIKPTINVDYDGERCKTKRILKVKWGVRRSFNRYFEESFSR